MQYDILFVTLIDLYWLGQHEKLRVEMHFNFMFKRVITLALLLTHSFKVETDWQTSFTSQLFRVDVDDSIVNDDDNDLVHNLLNST